MDLDPEDEEVSVTVVITVKKKNGTTVQLPHGSHLEAILLDGIEDKLYFHDRRIVERESSTVRYDPGIRRQDGY